MKHIDEGRIQETLERAAARSAEEVRAILRKARTLAGLSPDEAAALLAVTEPSLLAEIGEAASFVKREIYGDRIVLFAPLYATSFCVNDCVYCAFRRGNGALTRATLTPEEIVRQTRYLLERGHKRILLVAGESSASTRTNVEEYLRAIDAIYGVAVGPNRIRRVNINCAPLTVEGFKKLKAAGIGTYQLFQETYHDATYRSVHPAGPKSDPDNRLDAIDRAMEAGIDDVGLGVLYGLYDYRFETLALLHHIAHLEKRWGVGPHTISVPRLEPASGAPLADNPPYRVSDDDFKKLVAVLRLTVPYTGIILSTRETAAMRDTLVGLGISQMSAESKTVPGGYGAAKRSDEDNGQFSLADERSIDAVIASLIERGHMPSFCAACYRSARTGEAFMDLARPGLIKGKCRVNALITLKEYLDDFASPATKEAGYRLIDTAMATLDGPARREIERYFAGIDRGVRDAFV